MRQILAAVPLRVIAVNHDTSVAMLERTYSRYIGDHADSVSAARAARHVGAARGPGGMRFGKLISAAKFTSSSHPRGRASRRCSHMTRGKAREPVVQILGCLRPYAHCMSQTILEPSSMICTERTVFASALRGQPARLFRFEVLQPNPSSRAQAVPRLFDPTQEAGVMFETVFEPILL